MIWKICHSGLAEYALTTRPDGRNDVVYASSAKFLWQITHAMEAPCIMRYVLDIGPTLCAT